MSYRASSLSPRTSACNAAASLSRPIAARMLARLASDLGEAGAVLVGGTRQPDPGGSRWLPARAERASVGPAHTERRTDLDRDRSLFSARSGVLPIWESVGRMDELLQNVRVEAISSTSELL